MLFRTDTLSNGKNQSITRVEEYLVENYSDNKEAEKQIESFAFRSVPASIKNYTDYHIIFYKKTASTSVENIKNNKNWLPPESIEDMIYDYWWSNGKFMVRNKFKKGKVIDPPGDINVNQIP